MEHDWLAQLAALGVSPEDIRRVVDSACGRGGQQIAEELYAEALAYLFTTWASNPSKFANATHMRAHAYLFTRHQMIRLSKRAGHTKSLETDHLASLVDRTSHYEGPSIEEILEALRTHHRARE